MKLCPLGAELFHTDGRTDKRTDRRDEANRRSSQFCERTWQSDGIVGDTCLQLSAGTVAFLNFPWFSCVIHKVKVTPYMDTTSVRPSVWNLGSRLNRLSDLYKIQYVISLKMLSGKLEFRKILLIDLIRKGVHETSVHTFYIYWPIGMKFSTGDVNVIPFSIYELRENHCSGGRGLLNGVNDMLLAFLNFFYLI